jgi:hypothetical protein
MPIMAYNYKGLDFSLYNQFSGRDDQPALRWIKKFDFVMRGYADREGRNNPTEYFPATGFLLIDEAATWMETTPEVEKLVDSPSPIHEDIKLFKELLIERFPTITPDAVSRSFDAEVHDLAQLPEGPLVTYYKCAQRPSFADLVAVIVLRERKDPPALQCLRTLCWARL